MNNKQNKVHGNQIIFTDEEEKDIVEMYQAKNSITKIAKKYHRSFDPIVRVLEKYNAIRTGDPRRKYRLNEHYFDVIDTPNKAYILGFLFADGTCGKEYRYCGHCAQYKNLPTWMNIVCSEECKDIYQICGKYNIGKYTKAEAAELLDKYSVATKSFYNETINQTVAEIYGLNGSSEVTNEVVNEVTDGTSEVVEEIVEDTVEEVVEDATIKVDITAATIVDVEPTTDTAEQTATATVTTKKKTNTTKKETATLDE